MEFPEYENRTVPEGHYTIRLHRSIGDKTTAIEEFFYKTSSGQEKVGRKLRIAAMAESEGGEFAIFESIPVWDVRYRDLLAALNIEHGHDIEPEGLTFEADIKHEPDRKDPAKSWPRIVNIVPHLEGSEFPEGESSGEEDIPF